MSKDDVITSGLGSVNVGLAGYFKPTDGATSKLTPLLQSSTEAEILPAMRFQFLPDPGELLNGFKADRHAVHDRRAARGAAQERVPGRAAEASGRPRRAGRRQAQDRAQDLHRQREPRARRRRRHSQRPALGPGAELPRPAPRERVREQRRLRDQCARQPVRQRGPDRPAQPRDVLAAVHDGRQAAPRRRREVPRDREGAASPAIRYRAQARRAPGGTQRQELGADELRAAGGDPDASSASKSGSVNSYARCATSSTRTSPTSARCSRWSTLS